MDVTLQESGREEIERRSDTPWTTPNPRRAQGPYKEGELEWLQQEYMRLLEYKNALEMRVLQSEERRRAFMHILSDLNTMNRKLADQRKAMIHILADYEKDR